MRLVRVDDAWIVAQLGRHVQARVARRQQHVPEHAVPVELEASVDCAHALDPRSTHAPLPAAALAQHCDVREEVVDARVIPVEQRRDERRR